MVALVQEIDLGTSNKINIKIKICQINTTCKSSLCCADREENECNMQMTSFTDREDVKNKTIPIQEDSNVETKVNH